MVKSTTVTSGKFRKRSRKIKRKAVDRPFDPAVLRRAREIAEKYQIIVQYEKEDDLYFGRALEFPNAMNHGATREEAIENAIDIATTAVAVMLEEGQVPPTPASEDRRDEQVNVRISAFERAFLAEAARNRGYRGISDFMRAAALASIR